MDIACSTTEKAKDEGADLKAKIESCTNPDSMKVYVQQAQAYAEKLINVMEDLVERHGPLILCSGRVPAYE